MVPDSIILLILFKTLKSLLKCFNINYPALSAILIYAVMIAKFDDGLSHYISRDTAVLKY